MPLIAIWHHQRQIVRIPATCIVLAMEWQLQIATCWRFPSSPRSPRCGIAMPCLRNRCEVSGPQRRWQPQIAGIVRFRCTGVQREWQNDQDLRVGGLHCLKEAPQRRIIPLEPFEATRPSLVPLPSQQELSG